MEKHFVRVLHATVVTKRRDGELEFPGLDDLFSRTLDLCSP